MNVFSKPCSADKHNINYHEYYSKNIDLKKYKIPELKSIAKQNGLHISGTKKILIQRIQTHFCNSKHIIKMQANYRRHLVQRFFSLNGPGFKNKKNCVNDKDFYTLDPLEEIDIYHFFSYKDDIGFIYGFHIQSLIHMFQKGSNVKNPYNREKFNDETVQNILLFYRLSNIIIAEPIISRTSTPITNTNIENRFIENSIQQPNFNNTRNQTLERLQELRTKDFLVRVQEAFMEIDLLGNYTQGSWFSNLNMYSYIRFIQTLYSIWTHRSNMSLHVRSQICPYYNPFNYQIDTNNLFATYNMHLNIIRNFALIIIENIVFSGGDIEYRKIGVMHILTALTMVSIPARESLPWLYESVVL
jgi:SAP domain